MKKKLFYIFITLLLIAGVVCAIVFTLPKNNNSSKSEQSNFLATQPLNSDKWTDKGNFAKVDNVNLKGSGVAKDPYKVYTAKGLAYFAYLTENGHHISSNTYIEIMNDIDLSAHYWTAISTSQDATFFGHINGNGHTIFNIFSNDESSYGGFIGYAGKGSSIKDLSLKTGSMRTLNLKGDSFGAFVCKGEGFTLENCHSFLVLSANQENFGGLVGQGKDITLTNCSNNGSILKTSISGYVGGLVGTLLGESKIDSCFNSGFVTGGYDAGGLVGKIVEFSVPVGKFATIINSYNMGNVSSQNGGNIAGIIANVSDSTKIINSYNGGLVTGNGSMSGIFNYYHTESTKDLPELFLQDIFNVKTVANGFGIGKVITGDAKGGSIINSDALVCSQNEVVNFDAITETVADLSNKIYDLSFMTGEIWAQPSAWDNFNISSVVIPTIKSNMPFTWNYYAANGLTGEGSQDKPYLVSNAEELAFLAAKVEQDDSFFENKYVNITANINLLGHEWLPIGNTTKFFKGFINGLNHKISNLKILQQNISFNGFLGYTETFGGIKPRVENLVFSEVNIVTNKLVGTVIGKSNGCEIKNVTSQGKIYSNGSYIGGIVGEALSSNIENTTNKVQIFSTKNSTVGGVVGRGENSTLSYVYNYGSISAKSNYIGGIIGMADACFINGAMVKTDIFGRDYVGGVIGYLLSGGNATNIGFVGNISAENKDNVGGLAGAIQGAHVFSNSFVLGSIKTLSIGTSGIGVLNGGSSIPDGWESCFAKISVYDSEGIVGIEIKNMYISSEETPSNSFARYFLSGETGFPAPKAMFASENTETFDAYKFLTLNGFKVQIFNKIA